MAAEELPVDLRTWRRAAPPRAPAAPPARQPETCLPLRKRRYPGRDRDPPEPPRAAAGSPPGPQPQPEPEPEPEPPAPGPCGGCCGPGLALRYPRLPPACCYPGLGGAFPADLAACLSPPALLGFAPPLPLPLPVPLALALPGAAEAQLAADVAAATRQDEDGDTALHIAVAQGNVAAARRLVALFLRGSRELDVYNHLRQTPLHVAAITGQAALVRLLAAHGASARARDRQGRSAAHLCCEHGAARCLRDLLLCARPPPDLEARDYEGLTALHVAVAARDQEAARLLLEHGADADAADIKSGRSPLLHAVENNDLAMAELLLQQGASVNAQSYAGCTALHVASGRGLLDALRLLLRSGADGGLKNCHNDTALAVAKNRRVIDILRGKASRLPPTPETAGDGASPVPSTAGSTSPGLSPTGLSSSPPLAPSPPQTPGARPAAAPNQRAEGAEGTNGASAPARHAVKRESSPASSPVEQPMGCQIPLPLANGRLDHNLDALANHLAPLLPAAFHRPIVLLGSGPLPNHVPPRDAASPPPGAGAGPGLRTPAPAGGGGS